MELVLHISSGSVPENRNVLSEVKHLLQMKLNLVFFHNQEVVESAGK